MPNFDPKVAQAAKHSNEVDDAPPSTFRDTPNPDSSSIASDFHGNGNKAVEQVLARKALSDLLPGGTPRLIDSVKNIERYTPQLGRADKHASNIVGPKD